MKDYVAENEKILKEWKESNEKNYGEKNFAPDGIINRGEFIQMNEYSEREESTCGLENELWSKSPLRFLFITKDQNTGGEDAWDVRGETGHKWLDSDKIQCAFFRNLMYQLYGLSHITKDNLVDYDDFSNQDAIDTYNSIALSRINVKKEGGCNSITNNTLLEYITRDSDLIVRQIENLDADILICCGYSDNIEDSGSHFLNMLKNAGYNLEEINNWMFYEKTRNKLIIRNWHLSIRLSSKTIYDEMMPAYQEFLRKYPEFLERCAMNRK